MYPEQVLSIGILCFLLGSVVSLVPLRGTGTASCVLAAAGALNFMMYGLFLSFGLPVVFPPRAISSVLEFLFSADSLSGFFIVVISLVALAASLFSIGYARAVTHAKTMGFLFNLFILSMYAVVTSANIITFLICWETMSIVSYFLVTLERDEESARAGTVYAVMTHIGTACIIGSFLVLYGYTGHADFAGIKAAALSLPGEIKSLVFILFLTGFGTKAGIIPLHTWLPRAHPAAPSNISSLMSGVMIKTGIYGIVRMNMDVLGTGAEWWGISILVVGAASSVLGVLYALMEHDIKRLLAYHSVENIGIILLGIGASMIFRSNGLYSLSAIALVAGLYHTLNHAVFKGLLFLGAGSVMHATHTRNMEDMGGLLKSMPYTGLFFLVGSVSICALPPFNGFVSEWLTFQSLLLGFESPSLTSKIISPLGGAALALTGALAAACFVKAFGISFLGMPRSSHAEGARESSPSMIAGMGFLALLCLLFGLFPGAVITVISPPVFSLTGAAGISPGYTLLPVGETGSSLSPGGILIAVLATAVAAAVFLLAVSGRRKTVHGDSWDCGIPALTPRMQYSATAFTKPIRMIFRRIYLPKRELSVSYLLKPFFVKSIAYRGEITPFFERYFYEPAIGFIHGIAGRVRSLQSGSLHLYLGYILVTLIVLLIFGM